jgi:hypothetical protein
VFSSRFAGSANPIQQKTEGKSHAAQTDTKKPPCRRARDNFFRTSSGAID